MKILYTNISPVNGAYTNLNHIFAIKKQNPKKVYLCVWDNFVFEHEHFSNQTNIESNKAQKLQEHVGVLEKLLIHLKVDYKIIYLSEAMNRLFRNSTHLSEFQSILSKIKIEDLKKGLALKIPFEEITLSRIQYIIADYLIATYLPELFPELCSTQPNAYLTSERFKVFQQKIDHYLKRSYTKYSPPKCIFVVNVPVIIHPDKKIIPSIEMSHDSIENIVKTHYQKLPEIKERHELVDIFSSILPETSFNDKKINKKDLSKFLEKVSYRNFITFVTQNMYDYFNEIHKVTSSIETRQHKKSHFITNYEDFNDKIRFLNNIKLEILKNCSGNNTSLDIAKLTELKLSTVSTYLTHLKEKNLIDFSRKPKRHIDSFVIDLNLLEQRKGANKEAEVMGGSSNAGTD